jgi:aminoglycoside 6'-N-acetyltransferase I
LWAVAELSIRTDVPSRVGQQVGYVEGLYVVPEGRGCGIARLLLLASRDWAVRRGCTGIASVRVGRLVIDRSYEKLKNCE